MTEEEGKRLFRDVPRDPFGVPKLVLDDLEALLSIEQVVSYYPYWIPYHMYYPPHYDKWSTFFRATKSPLKRY